MKRFLLPLVLLMLGLNLVGCGEKEIEKDVNEDLYTDEVSSALNDSKVSLTIEAND